MGYKESLYFTVPKLLVIKDIRLGIINQIFKVIIWIYVILNFFYYERHYEVETPSGYITSMWAETGDLYESQREYIHLINNTNNQKDNQENNLLLEKYNFCDNREHNYIYSLPYWDYRNVSCINLPYSEMYEKGEQEFFFMTMFTENSINLLDCEHPEYMNALDKYNTKAEQGVKQFAMALETLKNSLGAGSMGIDPAQALKWADSVEVMSKRWLKETQEVVFEVMEQVEAAIKKAASEPKKEMNESRRRKTFYESFGDFS